MFGRSSGTGNSELRVLFDGWPLVRDPGTPVALHLLEILEVLPPRIIPCLAVPEETRLPALAGLEIVVKKAAGSRPADRLRWEQYHFPRLASRTGCHLIHITHTRPPVSSPVPCLVSPAEIFPRDFSVSGFASRAANAMGSGGLTRAGGVLWPSDLPMPAGMPRTPLYTLPLRVHSAFYKSQPRIDLLPESYVFSPAPCNEGEIQTLAACWKRISTALGEEWTLLVSDPLPSTFDRLTQVCRAFDTNGSLSSLHFTDPQQRAAAIQHAAAVLHVLPVLPWGDPLAQALACARPLAAEETPFSDKRIGPAGYLLPPGDARGLAAAVITAVVEEPVAEQLCEAARMRASSWGSEDLTNRLETIYAQVSGKPVG